MQHFQVDVSVLETLGPMSVQLWEDHQLSGLEVLSIVYTLITR